jgi:hypothetical protein
MNKISISGSQVKILLNLVSCTCGSSFSILLSNSTLKHFVKPIMKLSNTCMYFLIIQMIFKQPEIWMFYVSSRVSLHLPFSLHLSGKMYKQATETALPTPFLLGIHLKTSSWGKRIRSPLLLLHSFGLKLSGTTRLFHSGWRGMNVSCI